MIPAVSAALLFSFHGLALAQPLNATGEQWLGMNFGYAGPGSTYQSVANDFKAVGIGAIRNGGNITTSLPSPELAKQDEAIDTFHKAGLEIHWVINYRGRDINPAGTKLADLPDFDAKGPAMATWCDNYKQRCIELFTRYSSPGKTKIRHYIVGNEPNLSDPFTGLHNRPDICVKLTQAMHEAARQVNPEIRVESSPVSRPDATYLKDMLALGLAKYCDVIGVHMYGGQTHPGSIDKPWLWLQAAGVRDKPVGISEAGVTIGWNPKWSKSPRQWQSDWLCNFHVMSKLYGYSYGMLFTHDDDHKADWALMRVAGARSQPSWDEIDKNLSVPQGLRNAGFETANDIRRQWYPEHHPDHPWPKDFDWQNRDNPKSGSFCAQIRANSKWETKAHQIVDNVIPGKTYQIKGWVRSESPDGASISIGGSQVHNGIQTFQTATVTANTWTQVGVDVTPTNPWLVISLITKKTDVQGSACFDDITVEPMSSPQNP